MVTCFRGLLMLTAVLSLMGCGAGTPLAPTPSPSSPVSPATLHVFKLVEPESASVGDKIRFTVVVMNDMITGADPGLAVTIVDRLPEGLRFEADSNRVGSYDEASRSVNWQGGVVRGGTVEVSFEAWIMPQSPSCRAITNRAEVTDAFGTLRHAQVDLLIVEPSPTATLPPPFATPTTATRLPQSPTPTATSEGAATETPAIPSVTPTIGITPAEGSQVPWVKVLVVTPDEPPVYYLVAGDSLYRSADLGRVWTREPLEGVPSDSRVTSFAVDYRHSETMYLCTDGGLYGREEAGDDWSFLHAQRITALAVDLINPDVLWAGIGWDTAQNAVIVKSGDRGRTWGKADHGIDVVGYGTHVSAILVHPNNPNVIWAHVRPGWRHGWPPGLVYRGGRDGSWERLSLGAPFDSQSSPDVWQNQDICMVSGLAFDPSINALYAGCDVSWFNGQDRYYRLLKTLNADSPNSSVVHWELASVLGRAPEGALSVNTVRPLAVDAREPKSLFVFVDTTVPGQEPRFLLLVSHDDGASFEPVSTEGLLAR